MMDIVEVAKRSGVPASTLRYYEELGLISSIGRRGLRRTFDEGVLMRLAHIVLARGVGFSVPAEIAVGVGTHLRREHFRALNSSPERPSDITSA